MFAEGRVEESAGQATPMSVECPVQERLKRSNSAPMINEISATMSNCSTTTPAPPRAVITPFSVFSSVTRARRFSTSSPGVVACNMGIGASPRLTPRINQLRREECIDVVAGREVAHEKEIHSHMQISQSWEDLTFETEGLSFKDSSTESPPSSMISGSSSLSNKIGLTNTTTDRNVFPKKIFDPTGLNLSTGSPSCSSPSPTRSILQGQRHCYSPSFHAVNWKNGSLSPSPTRKAFATRRSLSPISIRPSCLGNNMGPMKRKFELDDSSAMDRILQPPAKRAYNFVVSNLSRTESIHSPFASLSTTCGTAAETPESLSSADSPNFSNSPSSTSRALLQGDDVMSDCSNDPQNVKPMESDPPLTNEETSSSDNTR